MVTIIYCPGFCYSYHLCWVNCNHLLPVLHHLCWFLLPNSRRKIIYHVAKFVCMFLVFTLLSSRNLWKSHLLLSTEFENLSKPHLLVLLSLKISQNLLFFWLSLKISQNLSYWVWGISKTITSIKFENLQTLTSTEFGKLENSNYIQESCGLHVLIDNFNIDIYASAARNQYSLDQCYSVKATVWHRISSVKTLYRICFTSICNKLDMTDIYAPAWGGVLKSLIIIVTY